MRYVSAIALLVLVIGLGVITSEADPVINEKDAPRFMYTLSASSGKMEGDRITLERVPLVVYFSDRPNRLAGQLSLQVFAQGWDQGPHSLRADPPNATLSVLKHGDTQTAVIEISEPDAKIKEGSISFKVRVLEGEVPKSFGTATLFIDGSGWDAGCGM